MLNNESCRNSIFSLGYSFEEIINPGDVTIFFVKDNYGAKTTLTCNPQFDQISINCILYGDNFDHEITSQINNLLGASFARIDEEGDLIISRDFCVTDQADFSNEILQFHNDIRMLTNPTGLLPVYWEDPKCICYYAEDIRGIIFIQISAIPEHFSYWTAIWTQSRGGAADGHSEQLKHLHKNIDDATAYLAEYFAINPSQVMFKTWGSE